MFYLYCKDQADLVSAWRYERLNEMQHTRSIFKICIICH